MGANKGPTSLTSPNSVQEEGVWGPATRRQRGTVGLQDQDRPVPSHSAEPGCRELKLLAPAEVLAGTAEVSERSPG